MKALRIASVALCILLLVLPGLAIPFFGSDDSADENRYLADRPVLADPEDGLNPEFDADFESWLCDHFAFRRPLIAANALMNYRLLHTSANERVIAGEGDWLYIADTVPDYTGEGRFTDEELEIIADNLAALSKSLARRGVRLYVAIIPNKSSVYPQFMPKRYRMREDGGNIQRLKTVCDALEVQWIDLATPLAKAAAESPLVYLKTDTHWNALGAALAAREILTAMDRPAEAWAIDGEAPFSGGDLARMMGAAGRLAESVPNVTPAHPLPEADFSKYDLRCAGEGTGTLLVYRDSYGTAIGPWLAHAYKETQMLWSYPLDGTIPCDDALLMICERNLRNYLSEPPLVDDGQEPEDDNDDPLDLDWEDVDEDDGDPLALDGENVDENDGAPLALDWEDVDEDDGDPLDLDWEDVDEDDGGAERRSGHGI